MNDYKSQKIMIFKIVNIGRNAMKTKHRVDNFGAIYTLDTLDIGHWTLTVAIQTLIIS